MVLPRLRSRVSTSKEEDHGVNKSLAEAREDRLDQEIDRYINERLSKVTLAAPIPPAARVKLRGILKKYSRSAHPFRECVKDNMSRFGPGRTEAICATLKDQIKGTTKWRNGGSNTSESDMVIDADVLLALDALTEIDLQELFLEARALEEHGTVEASALLEVSGKSELERWGVGQIALSEMEAAK
jgi:hypothetical protein